MFCNKCGRQVGDQEKFCRYCGNPLHEKKAAPDRQTPPAPKKEHPSAGGRKKWLLLIPAAAAAAAVILLLVFRNTPEARVERAAAAGDYETVLRIAEEEQEKGLSGGMLKSLTDVLEEIYDAYDSGETDSADALDTFREFAGIQGLASQVSARMSLVDADESLKREDYRTAVSEYQTALQYEPELEPAREGLEEASGQYREEVVERADSYVEEQQYEEAIQEVEDGLTVLKEDEELTDKKEEIEDQYEEYQENAAAETVSFEVRYEENSRQYAVITGRSASGEQVWVHHTEHYEAAQLDQVSEIGVNGDVYYYVEGGTLVALRMSDGTELWRNGDFGGAGSGFGFGEDGSIYLCGYLGPDFFGADSDGKTLVRIEYFSPDYYWPYQIDIEGDTAVVSMEGSPDGNGAEIRVNLSDFDYQLPGTEEQPSGGEGTPSAMSLEEICAAVGEYYTRAFGNGDTYVAFESECRETENGYWMILRYQGGSSANTLATDVTVNTETGQVTDGWGGEWSLYD